MSQTQQKNDNHSEEYFPEVAERVLRKKWIKRIKKWFKYAVSVDRTEFEEIMSSIAPPQDADILTTESRASSTASDRLSTPPEFIVEENYEILRPRTRTPLTPLTPLLESRQLLSRKTRSADGVRKNKSLISQIFQSSSEVAWETTSQGSFKSPQLKEHENDVEFLTRYYSGEIVKDTVLERISTWLALASAEDTEKFKDVFRRLKKCLSPTTYSSLWLETSPKYLRNRVYNDIADDKEFASRKFVLPVTAARKIMEKQEEEIKLNSIKKLSSENDSSKEKILPAKLAPPLLTSYANFTSTLESPDFTTSISLTGNGVNQPQQKNESHFKVGVEKKGYFSSSTRNTFTPKDPEKFRLRTQFGEFSTLTSTIGATSNFTLQKLEHLVKETNTPQENFKIAPLQLYARAEVAGPRPFSK